MGSSFDIYVVDGDGIVNANFFGIIGDSQRFSYQRSKSLLSQQITLEIAKIVPNSNMLIKQV
jgi:hypothetical protein